MNGEMDGLMAEWMGRWWIRHAADCVGGMCVTLGSSACLSVCACVHMNVRACACVHMNVRACACLRVSVLLHPLPWGCLLLLALLSPWKLFQLQ